MNPVRQTITQCPVCDSSRLQPLFAAGDLISHTSAESFLTARCAEPGCGLVMVVNPPSDLTAYYPAAYHSHALPASGAGSTERAGSASRPRLKRFALDHPLGKRLYNLLCGGRTPWGYEKLWSRLESGSGLIRVPRAMRAYPLRRQSTKTLLDIGCGAGGFLLEQQKLGWRVSGFDVNPRAVELCRQAGLTDVFQADDLSEIDFERQFDVVTMNQVLEHIARPNRFMAAVGCLVRPSGFLVMNFPVFAKSAAAHLFKSYWFNLDVPRHLFFYTEAAVNRLVTAHGFTVSACYRQSSTDSILGSLELLIKERRRPDLPVGSIRKNMRLSQLAAPVVGLLDRLDFGDNMWVIAQKKNK